MLTGHTQFPRLAKEGDRRPSGGGRRPAGFNYLLSLLVGKCCLERPGAVKGAPIGAAKRTLDGEDRSETIEEEGKQDV